MKIVIIGNGGSGKTWLANHLAEKFTIEAIHLDALFWEPCGFNRKRDAEEVMRLITDSRVRPSWVVEGVFGELAELYLNDADVLIWLDLPWEICEARLRKRRSESKSHMGRPQSEESLQQLIEWASMYQARGDARSYDGHLKLYQAFPRVRFRFVEERGVMEFCNDVLQSLRME